jgi:hypothetical protein
MIFSQKKSINCWYSKRWLSFPCPLDKAQPSACCAPPLPHLTCTTTKSNIFLLQLSSATLTYSDFSHFKLNLVSIFHRLRRSKESKCERFRNSENRDHYQKQFTDKVDYCFRIEVILHTKFQICKGWRFRPSVMILYRWASSARRFARSRRLLLQSQAVQEEWNVT